MASKSEPVRLVGAVTEHRSPYVLFPVQYPLLWNAYKLAQSSFWTADEIDLTEDARQWKSLLDERERNFLSLIFAFFAASDGIVVDNLALRFCQEVDVPEVRCFYGFQLMIENVHAEVYSRLIQEIVADPGRQEDLFAAVDKIPAVKAKAHWCFRWISASDVGFPVRLIAFAIVEGVFFSSSFAAIYWLRHRNRLPGVTFSNELIARDEGQHTEFACLLYTHLEERVPISVVHDMAKDAVLLEQSFFEAALTEPLPGMTAPMMRAYIEYVADFLLVRLGYPKIYETANPFPFMERTAVDVKTNFFERRVSDYLGATATTM